MTRTITVRLDANAERALRALEQEGLSASQAVRQALVEERRRLLEAEAERIGNDPHDRAVVAEIQAFMEDPDDPW